MANWTEEVARPPPVVARNSLRDLISCAIQLTDSLGTRLADSILSRWSRTVALSPRGKYWGIDGPRAKAASPETFAALSFLGSKLVSGWRSSSPQPQTREDNATDACRLAAPE